MSQLRWPLVLGGLSAALAVSLNALGAHALAPVLSAAGKPQLFQTALQLHQMHALGLILLGLALARQPENWGWQIAAILMLLGQLLFSGNLYLTSLTGGSPAHWLTPIGGIFLILSWVVFTLGAIMKDDR
jgi:uncharacterized membrane protein YgdD (TMEM256/DUF423 family)